MFLMASVTELRSYLIISIFGDFMRGTGRDFETVGERAMESANVHLDGGGLCGENNVDFCIIYRERDLERELHAWTQFYTSCCDAKYLH